MNFKFFNTKNSSNIKIFLAIIFVLFFVFENIKSTKAQIDLSNQDYNEGANIPVPAQIPEIKQQVNISVSPQVPKPGDDVTISVEAYGLDLNSTDIQWLINGKEIQRGSGNKTFKFNVGNSGESRVILNIYPKDQPIISKGFIFNPSNVDLLWQAETYTPPFYKGKALYSSESSITAVAIPNFVDGNTRIKDSDVVYKWSVDREVQGDYSGYGKNYFKYTGDIISLDKDLAVEAYPSGQENRKGTGETNLSAKKAFVLFYEDNPTSGIMFNYSLTDKISLGSRNESKVAVFPYNFSAVSKDSGLGYTWYINSEKVEIPDSVNSVTIKRNADNNADYADVMVDVEQAQHITQSTQNGIEFVFTKNN